MSRNIAWSNGSFRKAAPYSLKKWIFLAFLMVGGCATYHPMPLTPETVNANLKPPEMNEIRLQAGKIKHPLLKPVPFDDRDGLSPDEAAILAVIANPTLRAVRKRRGITSAQLLQAGILPNPKFSYSFETPVGGGTSDKVNAFGLGLDWNVTSLVARSFRMGAARFHVASVDMEIAWKEWQVAEAAKLHVYRLMIAEKRLALAEDMRRVCRRAYETAKQGLSMGVVTVSLFSSAKVSLQKTQANILQIQLKVNTERLELNRVFGLVSETVIQVEEHISLIKVENISSIQEFTSDIEKRRLDLLALRYGYDSQEEHLRGTIRSQFPKIYLGLIGARDTDGLKTVGAGISISIPMFNRNQGLIAIERATRKQLFDEYASRLFEARADIAQIVEKLRSTAYQLENTGKSVQDLKKLAEHYRKAVGQGRANIFDYYQVLLQLHTKQLNKLALQRRFSDLAVGLELASGRYISTGSKSLGLPKTVEESEKSK